MFLRLEAFEGIAQMKLVFGSGFMLALCSTSALAIGGGCFATCTDKDRGCSVPGAAKPDGKPIAPLDDARPQLIADCLQLKAADRSQPIKLAFRSGGKAVTAMVQGGEAFSKKLASYQKLDCLIGDSPLCEAGAGPVPTRMGKAFDPDAPTEVAGQPCALALPCGKVGLAADGSLRIRLGVTGLDGVLNLFPSRGQGGTQAVEMASSSAFVPVGLLKPGETYRYRLVLRDGTTRASGEFSVLSQRAQRDSDAALEEAMKKNPGEQSQASIESLMLDGRDWEAFQRTLEVKR